MKKILFAFTLISLLISCNKESTKTNYDVSINSFDRYSVKITGILIKNKVARNVFVKINYKGGNGNSYS